ncbi:MAG TPA: ferritin-like domain-containing protein [Azospirillaceae bacterium]|nr:ferritin-like domain-containing protein [Azospirillaceae bacterium]
MAFKNMQDLLIEELRDIYHAEKQMEKALPKLAKASLSDELRQCFETHREQTRGQIERLEQVFEKLDTRTRGKRCEAMEGLIDEAREIMEMGLPPEMLDAALIGAAQKAEHYEIASYGTVHAFAAAMGLQEVADLLQQTLDEEKETDRLLNDLAVNNINKKAIQAGGQSKAA